MQIIINGKEQTIEEGTLLSHFIEESNLVKERIIIQIDEEIIKKELFNTTILKENSKMEILSIVGGG